MLPIADESLKDPTSFSIPTAPSLCLYCWSYFLVRSLIVCPSSHWTGITFLVEHFRAYLPPTPHPPPLQYPIFFFPCSQLNKHFFFSNTWGEMVKNSGSSSTSGHETSQVTIYLQLSLSFLHGEGLWGKRSPILWATIQKRITGPECLHLLLHGEK